MNEKDLKYSLPHSSRRKAICQQERIQIAWNQEISKLNEWGLWKSNAKNWRLN